MPTEAYFLGIDINAYGLAFSLHDQACQAVGGLRRSFGEQSGPGEHDPSDWWRAVRTGVKELLRRAGVRPAGIRSIGLTGFSQACVLLDGENQVLFPALVGQSNRLNEYANTLVGLIGRRNLGNLTGTGRCVDPGATAVKLLAVRDTAPRVWHDLAHVVSPRDYLRLRLSGIYATDPSMASRTLLFSPRTGTWSKQILDRLDIPLEAMPALSDGNRLAGRVSDNAARETGVPAGTPIVSGGCHQACAAIACAALQPGDVCIELGSNGSLYAAIDQPKRDLAGELDLRSHCLEGLWALQMSSPAAGISLDWFMRQVVPGDVQQARRAKKEPLDHFCELAAESSPGAGGVQFLPMGPGPGALLGLQTHHSKSDVVRAFLEGTALDVAEGISHCRRVGCEALRIFLSGPGARSRLWPQLVADAVGMPVQTVDLPHLCARGSAVLGAVASGAYKNLDKAIAGQAATTINYEPRAAARQIYVELLPYRAKLREVLASQQPVDPIAFNA